MLATALRRLPQKAPIQWVRTSFYSTIYKLPSDDVSTAKKIKEAPIKDNEDILADEKDKEQKERTTQLISIPVEKDISPITGVPPEHTRPRRVRIYVPAKNTMQSGTDNIDHWEISFDVRERWENPLIGWTSTGDPLSNMQVEFGSKEEAITHCEKNGWQWFVDGEEKHYIKRNKNYGVNFSWNRRTRVSTK